MAILTKADLEAQLLATLGRAPESYVYDLVTQEINRDLRLLSMQTTGIVTEAASVSLPANFLEMVDVWRDGATRTLLSPTTPSAITERYQTSGIPQHYGIVDGAMILDRPGTAKDLNIRYYVAVTLPSTGDASNEILTAHTDIYIYGAMYHHALGIGDPRAMAWGQAYEAAKERATISDRKARFAGAPLQPVAPGATP